MSANHEQTGASRVQAGSARAGRRDAGGRFSDGNGGGPGNPYARRVGELRRAMLTAVCEEDVAAIVRALVEKAKEGNVQAAKVVLSYTVGKPEKVADPDRVDAHEWELAKETAAMSEDMAQVVQAPPAKVPLEMARVMRPILGNNTIEQMAAALRDPGKFFPEYADESSSGEAVSGEAVSNAGPSTNGDFKAVPAEMQEWWEEIGRRGRWEANGQQTVFSGKKGSTQTH